MVGLGCGVAETSTAGVMVFTSGVGLTLRPPIAATSDHAAAEQQQQAAGSPHLQLCVAGQGAGTSRSSDHPEACVANRCTSPC